MTNGFRKNISKYSKKKNRNFKYDRNCKRTTHLLMVVNNLNNPSITGTRDSGSAPTDPNLSSQTIDVLRNIVTEFVWASHWSFFHDAFLITSYALQLFSNSNVSRDDNISTWFYAIVHPCAQISSHRFSLSRCYIIHQCSNLLDRQWCSIS